MNSRYSPTERIGVNAVERIVLEELGWIFREQPIVDVGVDAIIEQCENENPTGRFIAVQIKSGESNFSVSRNWLTYYASHTHYHYWLNLNIPIILVAHIPKSGRTYWQHVCKNNFKKTDKNWKLEIPKTQELSRNSKGKLIRISSEKGKNSIIHDLYHGKMNIEAIYDANENASSEEIIVCCSNIYQYIDRIHHAIYIFTEKLRENNNDNKIDYKHMIYKQKAIILWFAKILNIYSDRLEIEVDIYSREIAKVFYSFEHVILFNYLKSKDADDLKILSNSLEGLFETMDTKRNKMHLLILEDLNSPIDHPAIKEANCILHESVLKFNRIKELYFSEFTEGRSILRLIINRTREKIELINSGHEINLQFTSLP